MSVLVVTATLVVLGSILGVIRRHYIFAIALVVMGCYELTAPFLFLVADDEVARNAMNLFADYAFEETVGSMENALFWFFVLFVVFYLSPGIHLGTSRQTRRNSPGGQAVLPAVILIFGLISMWTGAGQIRLQDYGGTGIETVEYSRFFAYGGLLLVASTALILSKLSSRQWSAAFVIAVCMAPLLIEGFFAGRRQVFAPSAFLVLMLVMYSDLRHKALLATAFTAAIAMVFAYQFSLREEILQAYVSIQTESLVSAVLSPQVIEFVAVGSTSLYAWNFVALGDTSPTLGGHWLFHALNAFPFIKLGDLFFPKYSAELYDVYKQLAPWGGLSTVADATLAFGWYGMPLVAVLLGLSCRIAHEYARVALRHGMPGDFTSVYALSVIAVVLPKYRSGIGDAIASVISFSILYWAIALAGAVLVNLLPRYRARSIDRAPDVNP